MPGDAGVASPSRAGRDADEIVVLGIDPGTVATGYGVVARGGFGRARLLECGVIRTSSGTPIAQRIREIFDEIVALLDRHAPDVVAVEDVFHGRNASSALKLGHARGVILLAADLRALPIAEYGARQIKKAVVGHGAATKDQVAFMVQRQLRLREPPAPADAADGVAAALCHCLMGSFPTAAHPRHGISATGPEARR